MGGEKEVDKEKGGGKERERGEGIVKGIFNPFQDLKEVSLSLSL